MEDQKNELASSHPSFSTCTAGYLIPESAFYKIKALNSQLRLLCELAQRPEKVEIAITARALEETLALIENDLQRILDEAKFLTNK